MTTSRNPGAAPPPGPPENQEDRQRLFEDWVTTLRRNGKSGVRAPVPLAVQEAIRSSAPPPADPDDGKTQVYRGHDAQVKSERAEVAALASLDVAQTQVYRIPDKVVARAKERLQAQQAAAPHEPAAQAAVQAHAEEPNPDAVPTDRPPNMPADDHTAVFVPPPDLLARAQRHLEALAAEEAARASVQAETTGTNEPADLSLVEALAAVEASEGAELLSGGADEPEQPVSAPPPEQPPQVTRSASVTDSRHDSMSEELASMRPRYVGYIGWLSVVLLLAGVAYAVLTTLK